MRFALHRSEFVRQLRAELPEVEPYLAGYRDNLTMEVQAFQIMTSEAIGAGDFSLVSRCFRFARRALVEGNRAVRSAIAVSYLEHLRFGGARGATAFDLMPPDLREEWYRVHRYLNELLGTSPPVVGA